MKKRTKRLIYALLFLLFAAVEVLIALFIRDEFLRPYGGDILVVVVVYCFVRIFIPEGVRLLPLYVFLFAVFVELLQAVNIVGLLGLENSTSFSTMIGTTFDWEDILCYAAGCGILAIFEWMNLKGKPR